MRPQDEKAVLTKAIRRYVREEVTLKKIKKEREDGSAYEVIITPNSDKLFLKSKTVYTELFPNRISIPRFSDYIVRIGEYTEFIKYFRKEPKK